MKDNSNFKILIVDDIAKNIQVVGNILQEHDYDLYFANDGFSALEQIGDTDFDLILLDIMMPEMDGYQVCQKLKANPRNEDLPVIFLTAKTDTDSIAKAFEVGAVDFVTKPFNASELLARVKTHLRLRYSILMLAQTNQVLTQEIEERKAIQKNLEQSEGKLRQMIDTKDKFFSIVAHDLKNPFNTLVGFTELLMHNADLMPKEKIRNFYQLIHNAAHRSHSLLENLLEWSRAQTGSLKWEPESFDFFRVVESNVLLLQSTAEQKHISLISDVTEGTMVFADFNMILTVVRNFISNALKFTQAGGRVRITATMQDEHVVVKVADTGVGIAPEDMAKLFRMDIRHTTEGTSHEKGTGLGLLLCKEFIEKNKGQISIESELGVGTRFVFTLPRGQ